jgi:hypothetical protein
MHGNIDDQLSTSHSDRQVDGRGWLQFAADERSALFALTVTQGSVSGSGSATFTPNGDAGEEKWRLDVTCGGASGRQFRDGDAHATVTATVTMQDGTHRFVTWGKDVKLT